VATLSLWIISSPLYLYLLIYWSGAPWLLAHPKALFAKSHTKKQDIGWIDYMMHQEGKVCCAVWHDKQPVRLLSTHAKAILAEGQRPFVWRKFGGKKKKVKTRPMHFQYTQNMRGVDTTDQLRVFILA
jgi:hypothetical protein